MSQAGKPSGLAGVIFGWIMQRSNRQMNRMIASELGLTGSERVLEIGSGTGDALIEISARIPAGNVLGIDHSSLMVKHARSRNRSQDNVTIQLADFALFSAQPESFERILLSNVHQFWDEPVARFKQIAQLLSAGGILTVAIRIQDPQNRSYFSRIGYDQTRQQQLFEQLNQAGFNTLIRSYKTLVKMDMLLIQCSLDS